MENALLSSNSYNFFIQPNIAIKFVVYVAGILLCKRCKFGEKICCNFGDIEFLLGDCFFGAPCRYPYQFVCILGALLTVSNRTFDVSLLIELGDCDCGCVGSCWKEHTAVVVLNTVWFMVRQLLTQREFSSCRNTLNTCMLISIQVQNVTF